MGQSFTSHERHSATLSIIESIRIGDPLILQTILSDYKHKHINFDPEKSVLNVQENESDRGGESQAYNIVCNKKVPKYLDILDWYVFCFR